MSYELEKIVQALSDVQKIAGVNTAQLLDRARDQLGLNNFEAAKSDFETIIGLEPEMAGAFHGLGVCQLKLGLIDKAIESFVKALQLERDSATFLKSLVECCMGAKRWKELRTALWWYCAENPSDRESEISLAFCSFQMGKICEAERLIDKVLLRDSSNQQAKSIKEAILVQRATPSDD